MDGDRGRTEPGGCRMSVTSGVVEITLRGIIGHPEGQRLLDALASGLAAGGRMLILDLSSVEAIEPGVPGRVITRCVERRVLYPEAALVTRSAGYVALARAAAVVFKHRRIHVVPTRADAEAIALGSAARARETAERGASTVSGVHPSAGVVVNRRDGATRRSVG
jgi:hypothetical protein